MPKKADSAGFVKIKFLSSSSGDARGCEAHAVIKSLFPVSRSVLVGRVRGDAAWREPRRRAVDGGA